MKSWRIGRSVASIVCAVFVLGLQAAAAMAQSDQEKLVDAAVVTFNSLLKDPQMSWLKENIGKARAVLIAPSIVKGGFVLGGSGGRAVLVARDAKTGQWVGPAFYSMGTASVGFQVGVEVSEAVTLVMTDKALNGLLSSSFKMGGDASVAAGPVGVGNKAVVTADMIAFSHSKGLYGGLNLDGTVVKTSDWNDNYYGRKGVLPPDILIRGGATNKQGERLRAAVASAAGKR